MRIGNALKNTRQGLERNYQQGVKWKLEKSYLNDYLYSVSDEDRIVWSWAMLDHDEYSFIGWGFIFPNDRDIWELRKSFGILPKEPYVFMILSSQGEKVKNNFKDKLNIRPDNWFWTHDVDISDNLGLVFKPLSDFLAYDVDFSKAFFEWVDRRFGQALRLFRVLIGTTDK